MRNILGIIFCCGILAACGGECDNDLKDFVLDSAEKKEEKEDVEKKEKEDVEGKEEKFGEVKFWCEAGTLTIQDVPKKHKYGVNQWLKVLPDLKVSFSSKKEEMPSLLEECDRSEEIVKAANYLVGEFNGRLFFPTEESLTGVFAPDCSTEITLENAAHVGKFLCEKGAGLSCEAVRMSENEAVCEIPVDNR